MERGTWKESVTFANGVPDAAHRRAARASGRRVTGSAHSYCDVMLVTGSAVSCIKLADNPSVLS